MKIKLLANNIQKEIEEYSFEFIEESTLFDIKSFLKVEKDLIDFPEYYDHPTQVYYFDQIIPYIEINNKVYFDVDLDKVKVVDFINTYNIKDEIKLDYNFSAMGGGALHFSLEIIKVLLKVCGIIADIKGTSDFIEELNKRLLNHKGLTNKGFKNNHNSFSIFNYIYSSNNWNHFVLAEKLNLNKDITKDLLKISGYSWDNSKKLFIITEDKKKEYQNKIFDTAIKLTQEREMKNK